MKILKKLMIITLMLIIVIFSLIPPKPVIAASKTIEDVGSAISSVAKDFSSRYASESIYDCGIKGGYYNDSVDRLVEEFWGREQAYQNKKTTGIAYDLGGNATPYEDKYAMDCVGFVSMIIHRATGLGAKTFTYFAQPTRYDNGSGVCGTFFENPKDNVIKEGDIICWNGHVAISIGGGKVIDSVPEGVAIRNASLYGLDYKVVRIKKSAIDNTDLKYTWYESAGSTGGSNVIDSSNKYVITTKNTYGNADKFYYNGMPLSGNYLGHDKSNWLIDALANVADWLLGVMTLGYKIQIVGWSTIFQNLATNIVSSISTIDQQLTAEKILFNEVQILDINFFNLETAGGEKITKDDIVFDLRMNIASIYFSIRSIAIIALLIVLLYVGIRLAISTVSEDKAKYRKMLTSWCVSFIVIMFIHYFMVVIVNVNEEIVNFVSPEEGATVIYDEARSYAYEISASKGWTGTIVYLFLVYYMIKLLLFYFKRLLVVFVLAIMAPIVGLLYAIQMMQGKSKSLFKWMKEFAFNVLIQAIHVIVYGVFMNIIYRFMNTSNIFNMFPYAIIMILILNLMIKSEKTIKKIFGIKSSTLKDVTDSIISASGTLVSAAAIINPVYKAGKAKIANAYGNSVDRRIDAKYAHLENSLAEVEGSKLATDIQREIDRLKDIEKKQRRQYNANAINRAKGLVHGMAGIVGAVPLMFEQGPVEGGFALLGGRSLLNGKLGTVNEENLDEEKIDKLLEKYNMLPTDTMPEEETPENPTIRTYNTEKLKRYKPGEVLRRKAVSSATAGTSTRVIDMLATGKEEKEKLLHNTYQTRRIELLYSLQTKVLQEEKRLNTSINNIKSNGFPPVFYTPRIGDDSKTVKMNIALQEKYSKELELNLKQAIAGNPAVDRDVVEDYIALHGKTNIDLDELQKILDEIAKETDYDVGGKFENNVKDSIAKELTKLAEKREAGIKIEKVKAEIMDKIEDALKNNDWDEKKARGEINSIVTSSVAEEIMQQLSASELASIITTAINRKGSLQNKPVRDEFKEVVDSAAKIADMNNDITELSRGEKYNSQELVEEILNRNI